MGKTIICATFVFVSPPKKPTKRLRAQIGWQGNCSNP
jgi:hypothetical protein